MSYQMVRAVLNGACAKGAAWQVLVVLAEHADEDGTGAYPAVQTIVNETNLSHSAVRAALRRLAADGYIARSGVSQWGTVDWTLTLGKWPAKPEALTEREMYPPSERRSDTSEARSDAEQEQEVTQEPSSDRRSGSSERELDASEAGADVSERRAPKPSSEPPVEPSSEVLLVEDRRERGPRDLFTEQHPPADVPTSFVVARRLARSHFSDEEQTVALRGFQLYGDNLDLVRGYVAAEPQNAVAA